MADEPAKWYVRIRGRTLGPFTGAQLESLRDRGQLARFHEVSQDRQTWSSAGGLPQLFPMAEARAGSLGQVGSLWASADPNAYNVVSDPGAQPTGRPARDDPCWFYAQGGTHQGPFRLSELQRMASAGEIAASTLIWQEGMPSWVP